MTHRIQMITIVTTVLACAPSALQTQASPTFETTQLREDYDYLAPDDSEIRLLSSLGGGGLAHCTLPAGQVSRAVRHQTVEEIWYFLGGQGQVWRRQGDREEVVDVSPGICLTIPVGTHFQFQNTGHEPLTLVISTLPPWPGEGEAVRVEDHWSVE